MQTDTPKLPRNEVSMHHFIDSLKCYWPQNSKRISSLPIRPQLQINIQIPLRLIPVSVPRWAESAAVDNMLLVPQELIPLNYIKDSENLWKDIDWFSVGFILLEGWHERCWEAEHGPIHSYSLNLKGWDKRVWQNAWVNRIALFLRAWAAQLDQLSERKLFGDLPKTKILMTHDVDAVKKTVPIRIKQGLFIGLNALRALSQGNIKIAISKARKALSFMLSQEDWWKFNELLAAEKSKGISSVFHFYADDKAKSFKCWLIDPSYNISNPKIQELIKKILNNKHKVGLHPGYDSWENSEDIRRQKEKLEEVSGAAILDCRQHWLRFSWQKTWEAQEKTGIQSDTTLMFNDRPGFRNASALVWNPWDSNIQCARKLEVLPSVLMDSHLYDYQELSDSDRRKQIFERLSECRSVHGQIAVLWHPQTLTKDYGWSYGFNVLLEIISELANQQK